MQRYSEKAFETDKLENQTVYYHRVNTPQNEDIRIFTHPNAYWGAVAQVSNDGKYLMLTISHNTDNAAISIAKMPKADEIQLGKIKFKTIVPHLDAFYQVQKQIFFPFDSIISKSDSKTIKLTSYST